MEKKRSNKIVAIMLSLAVIVTSVVMMPTTVSAASSTPKTSITKVSRYSYNNFKVTWKKATGAVKYKVYRKKSGAKSYSLIKTTTKTTYNDTKLAYGTKYYYKVKAINKKGKGIMSAVKSNTTRRKYAKSVKIVFFGDWEEYEEGFQPVGNTWDFNAYYAPDNCKYKKVTWSVSDPSVLELTTDGEDCKVKGLKQGVSYLEVKMSGGATHKIKICVGSVTDAEPEEPETPSTPSTTGEIVGYGGSTVNFSSLKATDDIKVYVKGWEDMRVGWDSSNNDVFSVTEKDGYAILEPVTRGTATLEATLYDKETGKTTGIKIKQTVTVTKGVPLTVAGKTVCFGDTLSEVRSTMGSPETTLKSIGGYTWYVYGTPKDSSNNLFMIGILNDKVVAMYSCADDFTYGTGSPVRKGDIYAQSGNSGALAYPTFFYDEYVNTPNYGKIYAVLATAYNTNVTSTAIRHEKEMADYSALEQTQIIRDQETISIYITNALRALHGKSCLKVSSILNSAALYQSKDMALNKYCGHISSNGYTTENRIDNALKDVYGEAGNTYYTSNQEVAYAGVIMPWEAVDAWYNSSGHRSAMLSSFSVIGAGVAMPANTTRGAYWTQVYTNDPSGLMK